MGLYKLCEHKGLLRDRCKHMWWGSFRGRRVSLVKWTNREIPNKTQAAMALGELRQAIRNGMFNRRGLESRRETPTLTFGELAEVYKKRHVHPDKR